MSGRLFDTPVFGSSGLMLATSNVCAWAAHAIARTSRARTLVLHRKLFDMVYDEHLDRHLLGFEFQPELLGQGGLKNRDGIGRRFAGRRRTVHTKAGEIEFEIVSPLEPGLVDHGSAQRG